MKFYFFKLFLIISIIKSKDFDIFIDENCMLYDEYKKCLFCKNGYGYAYNKNICIKYNKNKIFFQNIKFYLFKEIKQYDKNKKNCDIYKIIQYKSFFHGLKYFKNCVLCSKSYIFNIFGNCVKISYKENKNCYKKDLFSYCKLCRNNYIFNQDNRCIKNYY